MAYAIIRHTKLKSAAEIAAVWMHNARLREQDNVDPTKTPNNFAVSTHTRKPGGHGWLNRQVSERIAHLQIKPRKNAVLVLEVLLTASPEFFKDAETREDIADWHDAQQRYLDERFGKDNVLVVSTHLDEATPHVHAVVVPAVEKVDGRSNSAKPKWTLDANTFLGRGRAGLSDIVQKYGKQMQVDFGLEPGQPARLNPNKVRHMPIKQHQNELAQLRAQVAEVKGLYEEGIELSRSRGRIAAAMIDLIVKGEVYREDGRIFAQAAGLESFEKIKAEMGHEGALELCHVLVTRIENGIAKAVESRTDQLDAQASELLSEIAAARAARREAEADRAAAAKALQESKQNAAIATRQLTEAARSDREAAAKTLQDAQAYRSAAKQSFEEARVDRTAAQKARNDGEAFLKAARLQSQEAQAARDFASKEHAAAKTLREAAAKLTRDAEEKLKQTDVARAATDAFATGVQAFEDGRISGPGPGDKTLRIALPKGSERETLVADISPAWNRLWDFVKREADRLAKLVEREKEAAAQIEAARQVKAAMVAARAQAAERARAFEQILTALPQAIRSSPTVTKAEQTLRQQQERSAPIDNAADEAWDRYLAWHNQQRGLGR